MTSTLRTLRAGACALVVAGALSFGTVQAFGASDAAPAASAEKFCESFECDLLCEARYGPFAGGYCGPNDECRCAV